MRIEDGSVCVCDDQKTPLAVSLAAHYISTIS